jgi:hypothetical protein|tara:strand:- start:2093 stop:2218 length:126 start_codon:yes stop_codon:yes gene_type:complete
MVRIFNDDQTANWGSAKLNFGFFATRGLSDVSFPHVPIKGI